MTKIGKHGIIVIFGENAAKKWYNCSRKEFEKYAKEEGLHYAIHDFETEAELKAYGMAMEECYGWMDYTAVAPEDEKYVLKLIDKLEKEEQS